MGNFFPGRTNVPTASPIMASFETAVPTITSTPTQLPTLFDPILCEKNRDCIDREFCYFDPMSDCGEGGGPEGFCKALPGSCPIPLKEDKRLWVGCNHRKYDSECLMNQDGVSMKSCLDNTHTCGNGEYCAVCYTRTGDVWQCLPDSLVC
uniref:Kazal-like domain-containing protein n=1 Tax=Proboscia inermis TaxID=420281 RepID=A0A7S0C3Y7_9STRA|mmetsp:Transcript_25579/g.25995  ORF Transcript_25579/g.25995 Transcript_25579/m.25995 type:complete len:150 (+) Transcript_25579:92-541(+)